MKPLIINIMPHGPAYHFSPDEKPDVFWEKPDGSLVGFWAREWPDLLGEEILKLTDRYTWEVWQPDYHADRIYSKTLDTGVTHYLFPAADKIYRPGIRRQNGIYSGAIIEKLNSLKNDYIILQMHGFRVPFYSEILKRLGPQKKFPVVLTGHGMSVAPISELFSVHRPLTYLCLIAEQLKLRTNLSYVDIISQQADYALKEIKKVYNGRVEKLTMGCDFDFWVPVPSVEVKNSIRKNIHVSPEKTVFLATGNFVPIKQLDRLIEVFCRISNRNDFHLIIAGHGDNTNTNLLHSLAKPLIVQKKVTLHAYVRGERLRDLYWASDVYVSTSTDEGSSVSVMQAMACELPVVTTPVGETTETMKRHCVGRFIPIRGYAVWADVAVDILNNGVHKAIGREIARTRYDWPNVARSFIRLYDGLVSTCYSKS